MSVFRGGLWIITRFRFFLSPSLLLFPLILLSLFIITQQCENDLIEMDIHTLGEHAPNGRVVKRPSITIHDHSEIMDKQEDGVAINKHIRVPNICAHT